MVKALADIEDKPRTNESLHLFTVVRAMLGQHKEARVYVSTSLPSSLMLRLIKDREAAGS